MRVTPRILALAFTLACLDPGILAEESGKKAAWETAQWPQWRGADRTGVSSETGLALDWAAKAPRELWRRPLGEGFSAISVSGGRLFTQYARGDKTVLAAFAAKDGGEVWSVALGDSFTDSYGNGPRATPTLDDGVVYALTSSGVVAAVSAADGVIRWKVDSKRTYGARPPRWGLAGSPLVEGDLLIVNTGGDAGRSVLALDKKTGELRWSARDETAGYAAPLAITAAGVRQVLVFVGDKLVALDPSDGATFWEFGWATDWGVNASMPIPLAGDRLFVSTGYDKGAVMLQLGKDGEKAVAKELWRSREMRNKFSSSVLSNGTLFGFDEGALKALDPAKGATLWGQRGLGHGSLIAVDGKLLVLSDRGKLLLAEASRDGYNELGSVQVFESKTWTVPTLAGGRLYLRDEKEIVAFDLSK
jgi:outer membrane protein assembly factor BamB